MKHRFNIHEIICLSDGKQGFFSPFYFPLNKDKKILINYNSTIKIDEQEGSITHTTIDVSGSEFSEKYFFRSVLIYGGIIDKEITPKDVLKRLCQIKDCILKGEQPKDI